MVVGPDAPAERIVEESHERPSATASGQALPSCSCTAGPVTGPTTRELAPLLAVSAAVIVPDLRRFGHSEKHIGEPEDAYSGAAQARSVIGLIEELGLDPAVVAGYDVGSFVAQTVERMRPDLVRALVISPPLPGTGKWVLSADATREFWYPAFHRLDLSVQLIDGKPEAVRAYLRQFWSHWSGPSYVVDEAQLDHLVEVYSAPGAFAASIAWYRTTSSPVPAYVAETTPKAEDRIGTLTGSTHQKSPCYCHCSRRYSKS